MAGVEVAAVEVGAVGPDAMEAGPQVRVDGPECPPEIPREVQVSGEAHRLLHPDPQPRLGRNRMQALPRMATMLRPQIRRSGADDDVGAKSLTRELRPPRMPDHPPANNPIQFGEYYFRQELTHRHIAHRVRRQIDGQ